MIRSLQKYPRAIANLGARVKFPKKLKGTIIEKWADYWKNLVIDYHQMLQDLRTDIQDNPSKALKWTAAITTMYLLSKNNPTEMDFKDNLKRISNEVVLVSEDCINTDSLNHLRYIATCYNEDVIHYRNYGLFSLMYTSELNNACGLYKGQCSYLQPTYFSFPSKVVDVGIMGRWWNLHIKTANYDVK